MTAARHPASAGLRLALDFGPLIAYFAAYPLTGRNIFAATAVFMGATALAMIVSVVKLGRVSPMQWFSAAMVLVLGGLTLWLHQDWFIKIKPTIYYVMVSSILWFGLWTGRPTLALALGQAYPGLDARGWTLLTRNWAIFFLGMAAANEAVWRTTSTSVWLGYKLWGAIPATMLFALANVPMLMRHGLGDPPAAVPQDEPPVE